MWRAVQPKSQPHLSILLTWSENVLEISGKLGRKDLVLTREVLVLELPATQASTARAHAGCSVRPTIEDELSV